jgi:hypothetical protein
LIEARVHVAAGNALGSEVSVDFSAHQRFVARDLVGGEPRTDDGDERHPRRHIRGSEKREHGDGDQHAG